MIHKKELHGLLHKYEKRISFYSRQIAPNFDDNCIHDFRITTKKLRALLRWVARGKNKLPGSFKNLYRIAGEIRNTQMLLIALEKEKQGPAELFSRIRAHLSSLQGQWIKQYDVKTLSLLRKKIADLTFKKLDKKRLDSFLKRKKGQLKIILNRPSLTDEQLHTVRKMLKDMEYVLQCCIKMRLINKISRQLKYMKRIDEQAGDFNDKRIALAILDDLNQQPGNSVNKLTLTIKASWEENKRRRRQELVRALNVFIQKS